MPPQQRMFAVVNPGSANGRTAEIWPELEDRIRAEVGDFDAHFCERRGHGTDLTRQALHEGYDRILSVGGDGTHNEVVNGFFDGEERINPKASMAILPQGTASDFARTLDVTDTDKAIAMLTGGRVISADIGRLVFRSDDGEERMRHFLNVAHFGLGGEVAELADNQSKALGGGLPYFVASLRTFLRFEAPVLRLRFDDESFEQPCIDLILANGRYFGGGVELSEEVRFDNGYFEIFVVGEMTRGRAVASLTTLYGGTVEDVEDVQRYRAKRVWAESDEVVRINLDGEFVGTLPAFGAVVPAALKLVTGAPHPER